MQHRDFQSFIAPALRRPQLWRLVLGLVVIVVCAFLWVGVLFGAAALAEDPERVLDFARAMAEPETPAVTLALLGSFAFVALGPVVAVRLLHARSAASLMGRGVWRDFLVAAGVVLALYGCGIALWLFTDRPVPGLAPGLWLMLLPLGLAGVALQTLAEELVFRGYLMQQLAARFARPAIWLVLPALIFGAVHYNPASAGGNWWIVVASATAFGLIAGDLTARTGSLGAAWGFHFANNTIALLFLATQGTITGLALFLTPYAVDDPDLMGWAMLGDVALLLLAWLGLRRLLGPPRR